jgi:hypothetical protein
MNICRFCLDGVYIKADTYKTMHACNDEIELLVKLQALAASAPVTRYMETLSMSEQRKEILWNAKDSVRDVYVIVRHFVTDRFGEHVGLAAPVETEKNSEQHFYRLCRPTASTEHLGVYVFNPVCRANGTLAFDVRRCQSSEAVVVEPDACTLVHKITVADMQGALTVDLTEKRSGYCVNLCFWFEQ